MRDRPEGLLFLGRKKHKILSRVGPVGAGESGGRINRDARLELEAVGDRGAALLLSGATRALCISSTAQRSAARRRMRAQVWGPPGLLPYGSTAHGMRWTDGVCGGASRSRRRKAASSWMARAGRAGGLGAAQEMRCVRALCGRNLHTPRARAPHLAAGSDHCPNPARAPVSSTAPGAERARHWPSGAGVRRGARRARCPLAAPSGCEPRTAFVPSLMLPLPPPPRCFGRMLSYP